MKLDRHFIVLFCVLLAFLILMPCLDVLAEWTSGRVVEIALTVFLVVLLIGAVYAISGDRIFRRVALGLVIPTIALSIVKNFVPRTAVFVLHDLLTAVFLGAVVLYLVVYLFRCRHVDYNLICASLCAYLLMGIAWALVYSSIVALQPDAFTGPVEPGDVEMTLRMHGRLAALATYYSFVTLTTLGYGDFTPLTGAARMLSAMEALTGQIYLAVLVARLVGLHIASATVQSPGSRRDDHDSR
jgi:hypothetical protein